MPSVSLGHSAIFFNILKLILPSASARHSVIFFYFFKTYFAECQRQTLGKKKLFLKINFAECALGRHSAKPTLPSAPHGTRQKKNILGPNFFLWPCDSISNSILKFWAILTFFIYFISLFRFVEFFRIFKI